MKFLTAILSFYFLVCISMPGHAAYLSFSGNWKAPAEEQGSSTNTRTATRVVLACKTVETFSNLAGSNSGATVVAGPHVTDDDPKRHLTVRLYKNNHHEKSCHVYIRGRDYAGCSCNYVD